MTEFEHLQGTEFGGLEEYFADTTFIKAKHPTDKSVVAIAVHPQRVRSLLTALNASLGREKKLRTALEWYAADDRRMVEDGTLEKVEYRPAWGVLEELDGEI